MFIVSVVCHLEPNYPSIFFEEERLEVIRNMVEVIYKDNKDEISPEDDENFRKVYNLVQNLEFNENEVFGILEKCGFYSTIVDTTAFQD